MTLTEITIFSTSSLFFFREIISFVLFLNKIVIIVWQHLRFRNTILNIKVIRIHIKNNELLKMWIFWKKYRFLIKMSIFDKNFDFWQKCRFLAKISISDKNVDFWRKCRFWTKMWISDKNMDFWHKCRLEAHEFFLPKTKYL